MSKHLQFTDEEASLLLTSGVGEAASIGSHLVIQDIGNEEINPSNH